MRKPKPADHTWLIRLYALGGALLVFWAGLLLYNQFNQRALNSKLIKLGQSVDCHTRPPPKALLCDYRIDGIDCDIGTRNWLREWHEPIDYACAQYGPDPVFVFSTYRDLQWDAETIRIMREGLDYLEVAEAQQP